MLCLHKCDCAGEERTHKAEDNGHIRPADVAPGGRSSSVIDPCLFQMTCLLRNNRPMAEIAPSFPIDQNSQRGSGAV
jgi:hypothetical protein